MANFIGDITPSAAEKIPLANEIQSGKKKKSYAGTRKIHNRKVI
jgi:hypothetical protein